MEKRRFEDDKKHKKIWKYSGNQFKKKKKRKTKKVLKILETTLDDQRF